jgi:PAS domain S-box-containing protein
VVAYATCELPDDDGARVAALHSYAILDTAAEPAYDDIARLAAHICGTASAEVNLVDRTRQWSKASADGGQNTTPRDVAFCPRVVATAELLVVEDARADLRFHANPLVTGEPFIRFYAGAPLVDPDGFTLGTVCVFDRTPRGLDATQRSALAALARQAAAQLALRRSNVQLRQECGERARAQAALGESEARFRRLAAASVDGVVISDHGRIVEANDTFCAMVGAPPELVVGRHVTEYTAPAHVATVAERVGAGVEGRYETHARRSDGTEFPVEVSARRLVYDGRCARVSVLRDISERRAVERVKNEFVSTVSHELRTPLTSIRGALGLIEGGVAGTVSGRGLELVRIARTNTERLVRLINTILDLEKMESGKMELGVTMLDPADVLAATLDGIGAMAEQQRVRLVARVNTFAAFAGDRDRVIQVLTNLVSNAIKFSPPDADVVVKVAVAPSGSIRFAVSDAGAGIRPEDVDRLFQKFSQLDSSDARRRGGTGLGLAISRAIVEQHGGQIGVHSVVGAGSEFWFELPHVAA